MVQSPSWEANWFAASQEIPRVSRNPKVHYGTHKRPPPVSILGQPNPVHIPTSHLLEIHPNIIHPSTPRSPQWSPLRFPQQDPIHPLSSPIRATCLAHLILLDFITRTILGEQYKSFSSSLCNLLHSPVTSSFLSLCYVLLMYRVCCSRWPRGLRRRSAAVRLLRLRIRIPPSAPVIVVFCAGRVPETDRTLVQGNSTYYVWVLSGGNSNPLNLQWVGLSSRCQAKCDRR